MCLTLEDFPIVFQEIRGWTPVVASLPFLAILIGVISSVGLNIWNQYRYNRIAKTANGKAVPEARLPPMALGAVFSSSEPSGSCGQQNHLTTGSCRDSLHGALVSGSTASSSSV